MTAVLVLIAVSCLVCIFRKQNDSGKRVNISSSGTLLATINLNSSTEERVYTVIPATADHEAYIVEGVLTTEEHYNVIRISREGVCVTDSDCPNGLCIHQGIISSPDIPIACLPNRLIISIESGEEINTDAWTY